jgi:hypothetical protein
MARITARQSRTLTHGWHEKGGLEISVNGEWVAVVYPSKARIGQWRWAIQMGLSIPTPPPTERDNFYETRDEAKAACVEYIRAQLAKVEGL